MSSKPVPIQVIHDLSSPFTYTAVRVKLCMKTHISRIIQHMELHALHKWEEKEKNLMKHVFNNGYLMCCVGFHPSC